MVRLELLCGSSWLAALGWCLGLAFGSSVLRLLLWHDLVEVDEAALLVTDERLKLSELSRVKFNLLRVDWSTLLLSLGLLVDKPDGSLLEWILAGSEELGVVVQGLPLGLKLGILLLSLLLFGLKLLNLLLTWLLVLLAALLDIGWLLALVGLSLCLLLFGHLPGDDATTLQVEVGEPDLVGVGLLAWVILFSTIN